MRLRSRLDRVVKLLGAGDPHPVTIVLLDPTDGRPPGRCERTNAAGFPVVEVVFDPTDGSVELPAPPYKLVRGIDPIDLV
jgi:hypothetical protein